MSGRVGMLISRTKEKGASSSCTDTLFQKPMNIIHPLYYSSMNCISQRRETGGWPKRLSPLKKRQISKD